MEITFRRGHHVRLHRGPAPGIDAANAHLYKVEMHMGQAVPAVVPMGPGLEFQRVLRDAVLVVMVLFLLIPLQGGDVQVGDAERQGRGGEFAPAGDFQAAPVAVQDAEEPQSGMGPGLLGTDITDTTSDDSPV